MHDHSINKRIIIFTILISVIFGGAAGMAVSSASLGSADAPMWSQWIRKNILGQAEPTALSDQFATQKVIKVEEESAVIDVAERVAPAVVSIVVTKDLPKFETYYDAPFGGDPFFDDFFGFQVPRQRQNGTEKREIGGGTGFFISKDGFIVTNKHVVLDDQAEYSIVTNDGETLSAKVLARDAVNDVAILKVEGNDFLFAEIGDSDELKVGQTAIAIGNALGEFKNTVSTGVISGLSRSIVASGGAIGSEQLSNVIQTDASINPGNSGGPLLNLAGRVIGINTAVSTQAENIGFAIPINEVTPIIESVRTHGKIVRAYLGIRYVQINKALAEANKLDVDYGALVIRGKNNTELAIIPGSPADKAGLEENDIILEIDGKKITPENPLNKLVALKKPGDTIITKVLHDGKEKEIVITLEEFKE